MSLLSRQLVLAQAAFITRYPNAWLVWEPGEWAVPLSAVDVNVAETKLPSAGAEQRPLGGDALCFALKVPNGTILKVGRAADNELVVPDLSISRLHAQLELRADRWSILALSQTKKTLVEGAEIPRGTSAELNSGQLLELGGVKVTFCDAALLKARVAAMKKS